MPDDVITPPADTDTPVDAPTDVPAPEGLGDAGKQALDRMKAERKEARDAAAAEKDRADALQAKLDGREAEFLAEREADKSARQKFNDRILRAEIKAAAQGKLADAADAYQFLDLSKFEVGDDGDVDGDAITGAIKNLIETKPYLAAQGTRFTGDPDGGPRNEPPGAPQLTQTDMERMSPDQIVEAETKGQFDRLLGRT
jgi:hypothetical protein